MSLNPLNELKRRLEDDSTPLPKRICLAKNVVLSHHFPTTAKENIVAVWLQSLAGCNALDGRQLKDVITWINMEDLTSELKSKLIQVVLQYIQNNEIKKENLLHILSFLENEKMSSQLALHVSDYFKIIVTLLRHLRKEENTDIEISKRILNSIVKLYKESKKKLEFILKLLDGENLETLFSYLSTECHCTVIHVCQSVLFPINKKSVYVSFLQTIIRKDNIDELIAEKGDSMQSVLKIMSAFFTFPKGRTQNDHNFLANFIEVFVNCFKKESQLIFAFYVMVVNSLNMDQSYLSPAMKMPPIMFGENDGKIKRVLFLQMLEVLLKNEVDISVKLTDVFGEKVSKVEIKKTFLAFLQTVMIGQLNLEGNIDNTVFQIIKTALQLDPGLVEPKINQILPPIMTAKKTSLNMNKSYIEMLNCLLETIFKLSRGTQFINQILPHLKLQLEAGNNEQFILKQKIKECRDSTANCDKLMNKLITGKDVFPPECVEMYGKWTSELMFRQNKELLESLQKDFEEHCLMMLEEGFVSPSIITLAEVLSAILSSFLSRNKMADHTVPKQVAEDFWAAFQKFEEECLGKFGECILKLSYDHQLTKSFLQLSLSVANLKLLNLKYSHTKIRRNVTQSSEVHDLSILLPYLNSKQWIEIYGKTKEVEDLLLLDNLLLAKTIILQLLPESKDLDGSVISTTKTFLIEQLPTQPEVLNKNGFADALFANLEEKQYRHLAKDLVKIFFSNSDSEILKSDAIQNSRELLNAILMEVARKLAKCFSNTKDLPKALKKNEDLVDFVKEIDTIEYFEQIALEDGQESVVVTCLELFKNLPLPYLEENYQLVAILLLLITKKCCQKKIRKNVDHILLNIFELTPKNPDLYKIFPVEKIFSFEERTILNLLTLNIKVSNNMFIIKCILESAAKKVKTDSDVIKTIVQILLSEQKSKKKSVSSIEYFSDPVFQIICLAVPIISKERKAITSSATRSILANLQEKLHKCLLKSFKNIDFGNNSSLLNETNGNPDESMVDSESTLATLNAMAAYSLTLAKYCETNDAEEIKNLECLWSGLDFFVQNAINSIKKPSAKYQHVDSSIHLLNVVLRYIKKLESHTIFQNKDTLFVQIWKSIVNRLLILNEEKRTVFDELAVTFKFLCEQCSVECFVNSFVADLISLSVLKDSQKPSDIQKDPSILTSHKVSKYLWTQILKANLLGPKCVALSKLLSKLCKDLRSWIQIHFEDYDVKKRKLDEDEPKLMKIIDEVCQVLKVDLDIIIEAVLASKKITLDYKLLDSIFILQQQILSVMSHVDKDPFCQLFGGCLGVLNGILLSREQLLEDRWPNYMQCYRALVRAVCARAARAAAEGWERREEDHLAERAHLLEKLTQWISKRKSHVSHIAAYSAAEICSVLERTAPCKPVRTVVDNCAQLLLQAADSSYSQAFLRRALASSPGHVTLTNMYNVYKRYHKYVGNA